MTTRPRHLIPVPDDLPSKDEILKAYLFIVLEQHTAEAMLSGEMVWNPTTDEVAVLSAIKPDELPAIVAEFDHAQRAAVKRIRGITSPAINKAMPAAFTIEGQTVAFVMIRPGEEHWECTCITWSARDDDEDKTKPCLHVALVLRMLETLNPLPEAMADIPDSVLDHIAAHREAVGW